jgi:hypothetical protein
MFWNKRIRREGFMTTGVVVIWVLIAGLVLLVFSRGGHRQAHGDNPTLLMLTPRDPLTLNQLYEGCLILGGTGAGKTTGPLDNILLPLLRNTGCGAIWLCAKPTEPSHALRMCRMAGREQDVIFFAPGSGLCCDPIAGELAAPGGTVESCVALLTSTVEAMQRSSGGGQEDGGFWKGLLSKLADFTIRTVERGTGTCTILNAYDLLTSAPQSKEEADSKAFWHDTYCGQCLMAAKERHPNDIDVALCADWWAGEWPRLAEKTRSIAHTQLTNLLKRFIHNPLRGMVAGQSNVFLDDPQKGNILILAMPVLEWRETGICFQTLMKAGVMRQTLRRDVRQSPLPVVCVADECQWFIVPEVDTMAQTVARQQRYISLAATQSIPTLVTALGGSEKARHEADAFVGLHMTKVLCASADHTTNHAMSELFGQSLHTFSGGSFHTGPYDPVGQFFGQQQCGNASFHTQYALDLQPLEFQKLAKGGPANHWIVESFIHQGGRTFSNGKTWIKTSWRQLV